MHDGAHGADPWRGWRQLLGAILVAVLLPFALRYGTLDHVEWTSGFVNVSIATASAVLLGHYFFRKLGRYPGVTAIATIFPTFTGSYALVLAVIFFLRLEYGSRLQLFLSFCGCLTWYYACHFLALRARPRRYGVVAVGLADRLPRLARVEWEVLASPDHPVVALDAIVADFRAPLSDGWQRFLAEQAIGGMPVYHVKQLQEAISGRVTIDHLSENSFGSLIPGLAYPRLKAGGDIAIALIALIGLALPLAVIAVVVRLDSPGPALFRQRRTGYRGRPFTLLKFRTMTVGSEDAQHDPRDRAITQAQDRRITRVGRWLRRTRLDELPQLFNIVRGDMSWIGPRPEAVVLSQWYENEIPFYRYRHIVRPGISGWAQVNQGHVACVEDVLGKLNYDFYYIKYFSATLDLLIVARTVKTMITGFGAK